MIYRLFVLAASASIAAPAPAAPVCTTCHAKIAKSYAATGMARTSGRVGSDSFRESFQSSSFGGSAQYQVRPDYTFHFARSAENESAGERRLDYFVGSGHMGRSYLYLIGKFLFQAPVAYYSSTAQWNLSPGYSGETLALTRPVETRCLECHASNLNPAAGTQNGYNAESFTPGVTCERCHGDGARHAADPRARIINPAKLEPLRRDSICARCHLTGEARIARTDHALFQPGEALPDSIAVFVWENASRGARVTSHFENLWQSRCKQAAGDRMWCGSCHDPHAEPAPAQRASFFREKCLSCHQTSQCKRGNDCTACHMPRNQAAGMAHIVFTDHSIPRKPAVADAPSTNMLRLFWGKDATARDLGLAYSEVAPVTKNPEHYRRAFDLLKQAETVGAADSRFFSRLADIYDRDGNEDRARQLYEKALQADPALTAAAINLGVLLAKRGQIAEAMERWKDALARNPALEQASMNLAVAQARNGDLNAADATLTRALELNPGLTPARKLLAQIRGR